MSLQEYSNGQITCQLCALTLHTAAVGTTWSLLCSARNGQAALYLFQKHSLCWKQIHSFSHCGWFFLNGFKKLGCACAVLSVLAACLFTLVQINKLSVRCCTLIAGYTTQSTPSPCVLNLHYFLHHQTNDEAWWSLVARALGSKIHINSSVSLIA